MAFSATDAAFEGFRIVRRNPLALLWWAALYALISVAGLVAMGLSADSWIAFIQMTEAMDPPGGGGEPTPEEAMALLGTMGAGFRRPRLALAPATGRHQHSDGSGRARGGPAVGTGLRLCPAVDG